MASAEVKIQVVARRQEAAPVRDVDHGGPEQCLLPFGDPPAIDTAPKAIPFPAKSAPPIATPAPREIPPHEAEKHTSPRPYDAYPGKFTMVPRAIAEDHGRKLGPTRTRILEAMHHLIHGYKDPPKNGKPDKTVERHQRGQISYGEIADLSGVCVRTIERQLPKLIEAGFVMRLYRGHLNKGASVYELTFKAPMPGRVVGPSGGQVTPFPEREDYRQNVGSEVDPTTDRLSGKYIEKRKQKESRSRNQAREPGPEDATAALGSIIRRHWPTTTDQVGVRCHENLIQAEVSIEAFRQAAETHGASIKANLKPGHDNPVVWVLKVADRAREAGIGSKSESVRSPPTTRECLKCDGTGWRENPSGGAIPCPCDKPEVGLSKQRACPRHKHEVVWYPKRGVELCVDCYPPPAELREEYLRMVQEWFESD